MTVWTRRVLLLVAAVGAIAGFACSTTTGVSSNAPGYGAPCATTADCHAPFTCGFRIASACEAVGACILQGPCATSTMCPCDDSPPVQACSDGVFAPVAVTGDVSCVSADAGAACAGDQDCVAPLRCGYAVGDRCAATGTCVSLDNCTAKPFCACDSSRVVVTICVTGMFASEPVGNDDVCLPPDAGEAGAVDAGPDGCVQLVSGDGAACCTNPGAPCATSLDCCGALHCGASGRCAFCGLGGDPCQSASDCCSLEPGLSCNATLGRCCLSAGASGCNSGMNSPSLACCSGNCDTTAGQFGQCL